MAENKVLRRKAENAQLIYEDPVSYTHLTLPTT